MGINDYYKSELGVEAYKKINLPYPDTLWDQDYDKFNQIAKKTSLKDTKITIQNMVRIITPSGEQWIVHDESTSRLDALGNRKSFYRSNLGSFPRPSAHYEYVQTFPEELQQYERETKVVGVSNVEIGYSIPWNADECDKLRKYCNENTVYTIQRLGGLRIKLDSFEDFKNGTDIDALIQFGHIPDKYEAALGRYQITQNNAAITRQYCKTVRLIR